MEGSSSEEPSTNSECRDSAMAFRFPCKKTLVLGELYVDYFSYLNENQVNFTPLLEDPVKPKPGYCFTMRLSANNQKVFLNICHWEKVPLMLKDAFGMEKPVGEEQGQLPIVVCEPQMYRMNRRKVFCTFDIIVNTRFYEDILTKYVPAQKVLALFATDAIFIKFKLSISRNEIQVLNTRYSGSIRAHWEIFVSTTPRSEDYNRRLISIYLNIDVTKPQMVSLQGDENEENLPDTQSFPIYPVRTETVFETVKRLAEKMLSPSDLQAFRTSSRCATLSEPEPTMTELHRERQNNRSLNEDGIETDVTLPSTSNLSTNIGVPTHLPTPVKKLCMSTNPIKIPDPPHYIPPYRPTVGPTGMPLDPTGIPLDPTGMPLGPTGEPFDLLTAFDVLNSDDSSNDTPNMAILRDIFSKPGAKNNPIIIAILNSCYWHLKDDSFKVFYIYNKIFKTLPTKKLPTFSYNIDPVTDDPNPITMIPGSEDNLYVLVERLHPILPRQLSPALEIQPIQKMAAERRLEELMNGASNFIALKNIIELYDVGDLYLFITVSSQDYENLDVFANVERLIAFRNGAYYRDINLPKPVIHEKARANFFNGILMVVLPIDLEYQKRN